MSRSGHMIYLQGGAILLPSNRFVSKESYSTREYGDHDIAHNQMETLKICFIMNRFLQHF